MPVANGAGSLHLQAMVTSTERTRVLFVCLGNICRSPAAEVVFRTAVRRAGIANRVAIDSAGTSEWYVGNPPDYRAIAHAAKRGYDLTSLRARRVALADFERHDWILPMDRATLRELEAMRPAAFGGQLALFLEFAPHADQREILDPYDGGPQAFENMLDLIEQGSTALAAQLVQR
jgi:protein-tyrosine phosphatase